MYAITSLLAIVAVSLLITRVATVVLVASGMTRASARFQARSAFTGSGFTTTESEEVVDHPLRRKVVMTLMLLGNAGIVAAASTLIIGFRGGATGTPWIRVLELVAGLLAIVFISRNHRIDRRLTSAIASLLHRYGDLPAQDRECLLELPNDRVVAEMPVRAGDGLAGRSLADLELRERGATVLGHEPADGPYTDVVDGETILRPGDKITVHASRDLLDSLDLAESELPDRVL